MLNSIFKYFFVASSGAPVLLTLAFMAWVKPPKQGISEINYTLMITIFLVIASSILIFSFIWVFYHIKQDLPNPTKLSLNSISPANKEVTEYFLAYLFPIIGSDALISDWRITIFFCVSMFVYIAFSSSYHFNPIIPLMGYRLYSAEDTSGRTISILSKDELRRGNFQNLKVKEITTYMYIIEEITDE